jgi:hypothetical protein
MQNILVLLGIKCRKVKKKHVKYKRKVNKEQVQALLKQSSILCATRGQA